MKLTFSVDLYLLLDVCKLEISESDSSMSSEYWLCLGIGTTGLFIGDYSSFLLISLSLSRIRNCFGVEVGKLFFDEVMGVTW